MRALLILLTAIASFNVNAQPPAQLEVSGTTIKGAVSETPLFSLPSCRMLANRLRYLQKQSEEMAQSPESLHEVRRGMLVISDLLQRIWVQKNVTFSVEDLIEPTLTALQNRTYGVSYNLEGRKWRTPYPDLPDGVVLKVDSHALSVTYTQTGLEYCYPEQELSVVVSPW